MPANPAIAILAAGSSLRMGRIKQLLPWRGTSLIRSVVAQALASRLGPVAVVLGAHGPAIAAELAADGVSLLDNPRHQSGPGTSVQAAARWATAHQRDGLIIMLADQPLVSAEDLHALVEIARSTGASAVGAAYTDGPGVPALFARACLPHLLTIPESQGAKTLLRSLPGVAIAPGIRGLADLDTPADYARACAGGG